MVNNEKTEIVESILTAAKARLVAYGLDKTTMNEIADDIGMSKASLYYYFANKDDLFRAVIQSEHKQFIEKQNAHLSTGLSAHQLLEDYADQRLKFFQDLLNINKLSLNLIHKSKPVFTPLFELFRQKEILLAKQILEKGIQNGEFQSLDVAQYAELFIDLIQGLRRNFTLKKDLINISTEDYQLLYQQYQMLVEIFCKGIKCQS
ncbi:MAG: TetR/AcrR family transcriptional regulator [Saprospiraceae bacterium]|nr:TetR/AcrR family transcriptional regulator [Saprospiraceae bacterium]MCB9320591.1 TetR/AcrR family transcriptional regulator [Lewinellaceae bacterium]